MKATHRLPHRTPPTPTNPATHSPLLPPYQGVIPYEVAAMRGHLHIVRFMQEQGVSMNALDRNRRRTLSNGNHAGGADGGGAGGGGGGAGGGGAGASGGGDAGGGGDGGAGGGGAAAADGSGSTLLTTHAADRAGLLDYDNGPGSTPSTLSSKAMSSRYPGHVCAYR